MGRGGPLLMVGLNMSERIRFSTVTKPCAIRPVLLNHRRIIKVITSLSQGNSVDKNEPCTSQNHLPCARRVRCPVVSRYRGPQEEPSGLARVARRYAPGALKHEGTVAYSVPRITSCNLTAPPTIDRCHGEIEVPFSRTSRSRTHKRQKKPQQIVRAPVIAVVMEISPHPKF